MASPADKEFLIFRSKGNIWEERILLPTKGQLLTFNADVEPIFIDRGSFTTSTSGVTIDSGGADPMLANTTIDIDTASSTKIGLLSSTDWSTFSGKQAALVSGTNIKTINSNSLLGSGDLTIATSPAGSNTEIQYNNSGSFGASSNLTYTTGTNLNALRVGPCYIRFYDDTTLYKNLSIGNNTIASLSTTEARNNIIVDTESIAYALTTGSNNLLIGGSGGSITEGNGNILLGGLTGSSMTAGSLNVGLGYSTLQKVTGSYNVGIGTIALSTNSNRNTTQSVAIGSEAGRFKYGTGNIYIGYNAGKTTSDTSESNKLYIDNSNTTTPLIYGEFDNDYLKINGKLECTGVFKQKTFSQTTQPTTTDIPDGYSAYWVDTDDSNRTYLCYNLSGSILKVELT